MTITGGRDCGKSAFLIPYQLLLGEGNFSTLSIQQLGSRFGPIETAGRQVNISGETIWPTRNEEQLIKALVGGDFLPCEVKNGPTLNLRPLVRLIMVGNERPHFNDLYIWERCCPVECGPSIPREEQDLELRQKLAQELPGIFRHLVDSCVRLNKRGDFEVTKSMVALRDDAALKSSHLQQFATDAFEAEPGYLTTEADVVRAYKLWCHQINVKPLASITVIKEQLRRDWGIDDERHRVTIDGERHPAICGLKLDARFMGLHGRAIMQGVELSRSVDAAIDQRSKAERAAAVATDAAKRTQKIASQMAAKKNRAAIDHVNTSEADVDTSIDELLKGLE